MEIEIWRDIEGYEGLYKVSNYGRVKSFWYGKEKILKPRIKKGNYLQVHLCKNKIVKDFILHRLVAIAFIPNSNNYPQVNHIDEDKTNNKASNLEWCTAEYNNNFGTRTKRAADSKSKKVNQYTLKGEFIRTWKSASQASRELKISYSSIWCCCKGKYKSAGGFVWKYNEEKTDN